MAARPHPLDTHRTSAAFLLAHLGQVAARRLREAQAVHDLKPRQVQLLSLLQEHGGMGQSQLVHAMGVDPSILVTLLNPLEQRGLVQRRRDDEDRRRHLVTLTPDGAAQLRSAAQAHCRAEAELLAALDPAQREELRGLLLALREGQDGELPACD